MTKPLLAISGKRFSGKDTFAALLVEGAARRGVTLEPHAFAAESKRMFVARETARGVSVDLERLLTDRSYKEQQRPQLTLFTMVSIKNDPLVFARSVSERIEASPNPGLITDVRLKLEVEFLCLRFDLHLLRIVRSDEQRAASGWTYTPGVDDHQTETELDDPSLWNEIIPNDGTREELAERAEAVLNACLAAPR